jgi:hypothetical protein
MRQERASSVPETAKQGAEARDWSWVEASVWTERMVSALVNGVKGGCWFSLIRWTNAFFAQAGLFTLQDAHAAARSSR